MIAVNSGNQEIRELPITTISDLEIAGLEKEREEWRNICLEGDQNEIEIATEKYARKIEDATNQPLATILKKAQMCNLNEMVLIDRDPGSKARDRMKEGAFGKSLHEKAKSSVHGVSLAGYIPLDQNLSKAGDNGQAERFNSIVKNNFKEQEKKLKKLEQYIEKLNSNEKLSESQERKMDELISEHLVSAVDLNDLEGNKIYAYREQQEKPIFAYEKLGKLFYESDNSEVKEEDLAKFNKVQVLSYITGVRSSKGIYEMVKQKITGDHDQLAVGTKIERNNTLDPKLHKDITFHRGFSDDVGHAITSALIDETKASGAVMHSQDAGGAGTLDSLNDRDYQEIQNSMSKKYLFKFLKSQNIMDLFKQRMGGNPYPEDFASGNYTIYQPNGKIVIAHNEQEIIDNYNKLESEGFNIGINPRWGWMRDENNKLKIDPQKISAQEFIKARNNNNKELEKKSAKKNLLTRIKDRFFNDANRDAENLYKLASLTSLVKLQRPSQQRDKLLNNLEASLKGLEKKYFKKYSVVAPTVLALVNKDLREKEIEKTKQMIEEQNLNRRRSISFPDIRTGSDSLKKIKNSFKKSFSGVKFDNVDGTIQSPTARNSTLGKGGYKGNSFP